MLAKNLEFPAQIKGCIGQQGFSAVVKVIVINPVACIQLKGSEKQLNTRSVVNRFFVRELKVVGKGIDNPRVARLVSIAIGKLERIDFSSISSISMVYLTSLPFSSSSRSFFSMART
jgi:hypothetical protein